MYAHTGAHMHLLYVTIGAGEGHEKVMAACEEREEGRGNKKREEDGF